MASKNWGGSRPETHLVHNEYITVKQAATKYGIIVSRLRSRIKHGRTLEQAVDVGPDRQKRKATDGGGGNEEWARLGS